MEQADALQAAVRSSQLALEANHEGYRAGVRVNIDVLNAQQQLFQARQNLASTRYAVLLNQLRLKEPSAHSMTPTSRRSTVI